MLEPRPRSDYVSPMSHSTPRRLFRLSGPDATHFLQGILTQDVTRLAAEKIQFAALLSPQGKILHDMFLVADGDTILLDTHADLADLLKKRLMMYKLRAAVTIEDVTGSVHLTLGAGLPDPRHPDLPHRQYGPHHSPHTPHHSPLALGIPECGVDFAPDSVVLLDAGYDLLHAVSFSKGCYVGQEITARMHYKNIARRGFYVLSNAAGEQKLALLRFEDVPAEGGEITVDNQTWHAQLPAWMQPKFAQFLAGSEKQ